MKKIYVFVLLMASLFTIEAGVVEKTYYFDNPSVVSSGDFQMIHFNNTLITGKTGEPALPYQSVQLLLPPGESATTIEFIGEDDVQLSGVYYLVSPASFKAIIRTRRRHIQFK